MENKKNKIFACLVMAVLMLAVGIYVYEGAHESVLVTKTGDGNIKWVDFNVSAEAMKKACLLDVESYESETHLDWITLLAYAAVKGGGEFGKKSQEYIAEAAQLLSGKEETKESLAEKYQYFSYYYEAYSAVLGGMVGEYEIENESGKMEKKYGLKAFSPIAKGFEYQDYDDFGVSRSFGYKRQHLGHDMMGLIGTPIIACESGYVEALGWNRYGGWRIGIRSLDKKRYYYYAHLRQNRPYAEGLKEGAYVSAGDVIGYMGHTGYSDRENVNNIDTVHLHVGLELIFDEERRENGNEIWIDFYQIARFLSANRCEAIRDETTKEWHRKYSFRDCFFFNNVIEYKQ
ncbi:M23 family metallopeptidase [Lachnospiraceae bacterium MD335]|nr:M23 family metallopeptidase [Lachnospiraceae bacterium MD335]